MKAQLFLTMQRTLRLEALMHGRTRLEKIHCPDHFVVSEVFGVNQFVDGALMVRTPEGEARHVPAGACMILPPDVPLQFTNLDPGRTTSVWHIIRYSVLDTIDPLALLDCPLVLDETYGRRVGAINRELQTTHAEPSSVKVAMRRCSLAMQLLEIVLSVSELKSDAEHTLSKTDRVQPALQYIRKHLSRPISVEDLASTMHISVPHFFGLFREAVGVSPGKYVRQQRIKKAQELLISSNRRIFEIAEAVGYEDPFNFSRQFKQNVGVSPNAFRKRWG